MFEKDRQTRGGGPDQGEIHGPRCGLGSVAGGDPTGRQESSRSRAALSGRHYSFAQRQGIVRSPVVGQRPRGRSAACRHASRPGGLLRTFRRSETGGAAPEDGALKPTLYEVVRLIRRIL